MEIDIANEDCRQNHKERWEDWFLNLKMTKIVLAVNNEECLKKHHDLCVDLEIPVGMIPDAGYYETEAGTLICCAIGPITDEEYKLLKLKKWKLFR